MTPTITPEALEGLAHEIWAAAQLAPGEGILDGTARIKIYLGALTKLQAAPAAAGVPDHLDVRRILLCVVPGLDGEGHEVYARNVEDVERKLNQMGERIAELDHTQPSANDYCTPCKGSGVVEGITPDPNGDPQYDAPGIVRCPKCNGTGEPPAQPQAEQDRASETSRRQAAVAHMLGEGWRWDGAQWCREPENVESMRQQSVAWLAVTEAIARLVPDWLNMGDTGIERAVAAIEALAARQPVAMSNAGNSEAEFVEDGAALNCPACGGSGHVDDARQPVGEPVEYQVNQGRSGWVKCDKAHYEDGKAYEAQHGAPANGSLYRALVIGYTAPPAQVDLGQFREAVELWKLHAQCRQDERVKGIDWNARIAKADELLALIASQHQQQESQ